MPIHCVAFSPDGEYVAVGGVSRSNKLERVIVKFPTLCCDRKVQRPLWKFGNLNQAQEFIS